MLLNSQNTGFAKASSVEIPEHFYNRMVTGSEEVDLMFGTQDLPGLMPGSALTLCGVPGGGKTTFTCQLLQMLSDNGYSVGYASGEESKMQLAYTCKRLNVDIPIAHMNDVDEIAEAMDNFDIIVVDSFQALRSNDDKIGKKKFLQYAQDTLLNKAKDTNCVLIFILHITVQGLPKGGTDLIHAVDVNVKLTVDKEDDTIRLIDVYKNRFGPTKVHQALMGGSGFEFKGEYHPPEETGKSRKKPVNEKRKEEILNITEPPHLTVDRIMEHFGISSQIAGGLMRELVNEQKLQKFGRGANACWKIINDAKNAYDDFCRAE